MINMPAGPEIMVILLLGLLVLGPDQLPKAMRTVGKVMSEIRKVSSSFQAEMNDALDVIETAGSDTSEEAKGSTGSRTEPLDSGGREEASKPASEKAEATPESRSEATPAVPSGSAHPDASSKSAKSGVASPAAPRGDGTKQASEASTPAQTGVSSSGTPESGDDVEASAFPRIDPADRAAG